MRNFVLTLDQQTSLDKCFTATIESLIELVSECASKRPKKSSPAKGVTINSQRKLGYCEFCGNLTEFSKLISEISEFVANDNEFPVHENRSLVIDIVLTIGPNSPMVYGIPNTDKESGLSNSSIKN